MMKKTVNNIISTSVLYLIGTLILIYNRGYANFIFIKCEKLQILDAV
jgi:hypothetical protein